MKSTRFMKSLFFIVIFVMGLAITATSINANVSIEEKAAPILTRVPLVFTDSVSQGSDSTQHSFTVASTATKIEVELTFSSSYDYDLSLWDNLNRRTGGWTNADHSLKSDIPNDAYSGYSANPETITIDPPATFGTWKVGCYAYSGTGSYTITVTITDTVLDTTPPVVSITSPANGGTISDTVTISATASDNIGVTKVSCNIDGGTWTDDTSSPYSWTLDTTGYADGSTHTINCRAYDAAGNYDDDTITVTVDNSGPVDNELTSGVPVTSTLSSVGQTEMWYIDVAANAESMESILTCGTSDFDLYGRLNTEPTTSTYDWRGYTGGGEEVTFNTPGAGRWYIMVRDYSGSGNYELTVTITYSGPDTIPPTISITSPSNGATVSNADVTVTWSGSDADSGIDYYEVQIDSGSWINKGTGTSHIFTSLADGSHTAEVRAWDNAGNSNTDTVTFTVDTSVGNELTSGVPVTGTLSSVGQTEMWYIDVATNAESMVSILTCGSSDFDLYGRLGAEPTTSTYDWRGYTGGGEEVTYNTPGAGRWYIMVRDYSGSDNYELTVTITYSGPDTTPPTISITSPSNGATVTNDDVAITWSGSDADSGIDYYEVLIDSGSWINKGPSTSHTFIGLADGSHTAEVRAWDNAGNSNTDTVTFTVDTTIVNEVTKYAVIVGISDYKAISDLSYCDEDATDWYNHLTGSQMDYDHIWVYGDGHTTNYPQWDGYATEYNIKQALINMVNLADDNDIIAFITSGHGAGDGAGSSYICAWDCGSGESGENGDFYDTELTAILDDAIAERIFVFIDHCYSGGFGPDLMNMGNGARVYCTTTCTEDGYGWDDPTHQNGAWTYYFLDYAWISHFGGSATVSMEAVFDYAHAAYPHTGGDESEEYDGNTSASFYMA